MEVGTDVSGPITAGQQAAVEALRHQRDLAPRWRERLEMVKAAWLREDVATIARWSGRTPRTVRRWLRDHNRRVHRAGGVRLVPCLLPSKSPWRNPIEPQWVHGKRRVVEPARLLTARELEDRVCAAFGCLPSDHLAIPKEVA